jgi:hypothetical protein
MQTFHYKKIFVTKLGTIFDGTYRNELNINKFAHFIFYKNDCIVAYKSVFLNGITKDLHMCL